MGLQGSIYLGAFVVGFMGPHSLANMLEVSQPGEFTVAWYETELGDTQKITLTTTPAANGPCAKGTLVEFSERLDSLILTCSGFNGTQQSVKQVLVKSQMGWHIRQKLKFIKMGRTVIYTEPEPTFYHKRGDVGGRVDPRSEMWAQGPGKPSGFDNKISQVDIDESLFPPLPLPDSKPSPMGPSGPDAKEGDGCPFGRKLKDGLGGCAIDV